MPSPIRIATAQHLGVFWARRESSPCNRNAAPDARRPWPLSRDGLQSVSLDVAYPEVALNQTVKNLIQKLGEAIHESVAESENIAGVVKDIREHGFDVLLMLEATIGLNEVDADESEADSPSDPSAVPVDGPFTHHDLSFLKSLRISLTAGSENGD